MEPNDITKMFEAVTKVFESRLNKEITSLIVRTTQPRDQYHSESIDQVSAAFAAAQGEFEPVVHNRINPFFKSHYTDLDGILKAVKPALSDHKLVIYNFTKLSDGYTILHTRLVHESGQWIETRARIIPAKDDIQGLGSAMSYHKRYNILNLLGISTKEDLDDDDGEVDMIPHRNMSHKGTAPNLRSKPQKPTETITPEQLEELQDMLQNHPDIAEDILEKMRIQTLSDMPKEYYLKSIKRVREIINLREGK
jgi:ERF superfamily